MSEEDKWHTNESFCYTCGQRDHAASPGNCLDKWHGGCKNNWHYKDNTTFKCPSCNSTAKYQNEDNWDVCNGTPIVTTNVLEIETCIVCQSPSKYYRRYVGSERTLCHYDDWHIDDIKDHFKNPDAVGVVDNTGTTADYFTRKYGWDKAKDDSDKVVSIPLAHEERPVQYTLSDGTKRIRLYPGPSQACRDVQGREYVQYTLKQARIIAEDILEILKDKDKVETKPLTKRQLPRIYITKAQAMHLAQSLIAVVKDA